MKQIFVAAIAALALSGCQTVNHSVGSAQWNFDTQAYPEDYREAAARAVAGRSTIDGSDLLISQPNTMVGQHAFAPMRWYVCVRGIEPRGTPSQIYPLQRAIDDWIDPPLSADPFDVIVIFEDGKDWRTVQGFNSRLCRDAEFERL